MTDRTAEWLQNTRIHQESAALALKVEDTGSWCLAAVVNVDAPRAVAALEAVLALHAEAVLDAAPHPFHYCKTCSGHPAWPCPEVRAITSALTGEASEA